MQWKNIQAGELGPAQQCFSYVENAPGAQVTSVEFAETVKAARGLSCNTGMTFENAHLTLAPGQRLCTRWHRLRFGCDAAGLVEVAGCKRLQL
jgi:hypothetical protein